MMILPCKPGDVVEAVVIRPYNGHTLKVRGVVNSIICNTEGTKINVSVDGLRFVTFIPSDFGDTVEVIRSKPIKTKVRRCKDD